MDKHELADDNRYDEREIDAADVPADGESWAERLAVREHMEGLAASILAGIDPAAHAAQAITSACLDFEVELAKCSTVERAAELVKVLRSLEKRVEAVTAEAVDKQDVLLG